MSIKIGINGTASFKNVIDVIVGTSSTAKQDINFVKDCNGTIIWQRVTTVELTASNTRFNVDPCSDTKSTSGYYEPKPHPYPQGSSSGTNYIEYTPDGGASWKMLQEGKDYTISWSNNRVPATGTIDPGSSTTGTGRVHINGTGSYSGTFYREFAISYSNPAISITDKCAITFQDPGYVALEDKSYNYTADESEMTLGIASVVYNSTTPLVSGTDYSVTYSYPSSKVYTHTSGEGELSKNVTVKITGIGKYTGEAEKPYSVKHSYVASFKEMVSAFAHADERPNVSYFFDGSSTSIMQSTIVKYNETLGCHVECSCNANGYNYMFLHRRITTTGNPSVLYRSKDCRFWTKVRDFSEFSSSSVDCKVYACCSIGNRLIVITSRGTIMYSDDGGTSWTISTVNGLPGSTNTAFGQGYSVWTDGTKVYITVNLNNLGNENPWVLSSSDNGATFTCKSTIKPFRAATSVQVGYFRRVVYGNGISMMVQGNRVMKSTSPDADSSWTYSTALGSVSIEGNLCFGNGKFAVVATPTGTAKNKVYTSTDGESWSAVTLPDDYAEDAINICFFDGKFYLLASDEGSSSSSGWFTIYQSSDASSFSPYIQNVQTPDQERVDTFFNTITHTS